MKNEIALQKELAPVVDLALAIEIKKPEDVPPAVELLSRLNQFNDRITEEKEKITRPLLEALSVERARWKPAESANKEAIETLRTKLSVYQTAQIALQKAKESAIADKVSSGKISIEKGIKAIEKVKTPDKEVATQAGLVQFRESQTLKIIDEKKIPREYLVIDEKKLLDALKKGIVVAGAEIEVIQIPVNYR